MTPVPSVGLGIEEGVHKRVQNSLILDLGLQGQGVPGFPAKILEESFPPGGS